MPGGRRRNGWAVILLHKIIAGSGTGGNCKMMSVESYDSGRKVASSLVVLIRSGCGNILAMGRLSEAEVAEWQTRRIQNPVHASGCGFKSLLRQ